MKTLKQPLITLVILVLTLVPLVAGHEDSEKHGLSHFSIRETMGNTGVLPDASGRVDLKLSKAGKGSDQRLDIKLQHLEPQASYQLVVTLGESNVLVIAEFMADDEGKAKLDFRSKERKTKSKPGEVKAGLPPELESMTNIQSLGVVDAAGQTVLTADLGTLDRLHFAFKRYLRNGDIKAKLYVKANKTTGAVKLHAYGLNPETPYSLVLNGNVAATETTSSKGKLDLHVELLDPLEILNLERIELVDDSSNVVLSTTIP